MRNWAALAVLSSLPLVELACARPQRVPHTGRLPPTRPGVSKVTARAWTSVEDDGDAEGGEQGKGSRLLRYEPPGDEWLRPPPSPPLKAMLFIDGTWLYYSLFERGDRCAIRELFGDGWQATHCVDVSQLPPIIAEDLAAQVSEQLAAPRTVEVVRSLVFTSYRQDVVSDQRVALFQQMQDLLFEVHLGSFQGMQEKCVDIALAVEMLHYATVPDAYDIGVLVSGDRDFIPALVRTRQRGRRIAIASMRNSCNREFSDPSIHIKDFETVWLDDSLDRLIVPRSGLLAPVRPDAGRSEINTAVETVTKGAPGCTGGVEGPALHWEGSETLGPPRGASRRATGLSWNPPGRSRIAQQACFDLDAWLVSLVMRCIGLSTSGVASSRTIGRFLSRQMHGRMSALDHLKARHGRLSSFLHSYSDLFAMEHNSPNATTKTEFHVCLAEEAEEHSLFDRHHVENVGGLGHAGDDELDELELEEDDGLTYGEVFEGRGVDEGGRLRQLLQRGHMIELDPSEATSLAGGRRGFDAARQARRARRNVFHQEESLQDQLYGVGSSAGMGTQAPSASEAEEEPRDHGHSLSAAHGSFHAGDYDDPDDMDQGAVLLDEDGNMAVSYAGGEESRGAAHDDKDDNVRAAVVRYKDEVGDDGQGDDNDRDDDVETELEDHQGLLVQRGLTTGDHAAMEAIDSVYDEVEDVLAMTREELREELRLHGLPVSGAKVWANPRSSPQADATAPLIRMCMLLALSQEELRSRLMQYIARGQKEQHEREDEYDPDCKGMGSRAAEQWQPTAPTWPASDIDSWRLDATQGGEPDGGIGTAANDGQETTGSGDSDSTHRSLRTSSQ